MLYRVDTTTTTIITYICVVTDVIVSDREGVGEGTPAPNYLGDYTGRHFEERVGLQNPEARMGREEGGMTDPHRWHPHTDGVGMETGCGLRFSRNKSLYVIKRKGKGQQIE